jgi:hypothetical protein
MARGTKPIQRAALNALRVLRAPYEPQRRCFKSGTVCKTDGVYQEITAMRTRTPFIEAFRDQQRVQNAPQKSQSAKEPTSAPVPDLTPRTMSESYYRVVCPFKSVGDHRLYICSFFLSLEIHGSWTHISTPPATSDWVPSSWISTPWPESLRTSTPENP